MTKKNILAAAIAAITVSVSTLACGSLAANAASCAETDPVYGWQGTSPSYPAEEIEEPEYELAPPICILPTEEIPQQAWDAIFEAMDVNDDGEVRVNDAIQAKKEGNDKLSEAICKYIINDGYADCITMSPIPLQEIADKIRSEQFQLVCIWKDGLEKEKSTYYGYFMFYSAKTADFFVYETPFITDGQGFLNLWDVDKDEAVTEKDAAKVFLETGNEKKATAISAYAQFGNAAFAISADATPRMALELERMLESGDELVGIDGGDITVFDYDTGIMNLRFW